LYSQLIKTKPSSEGKQLTGRNIMKITANLKNGTKVTITPKTENTMTLEVFSNIAIAAGFEDLFDLNVSDIVESGSFSDLTGDRILEFKVIEMNDNDLEIIVEFDEDLHKNDLLKAMKL